MHPETRKAQLTIQFKFCVDILKDLLNQIKCIENDTQESTNDKLLKIKKIREELSKVGTEIDSIKKEIKIIRTYSLN
jgi:hypothetical protein